MFMIFGRFGVISFRDILALLGGLGELWALFGDLGRRFGSLWRPLGDFWGAFGWLWGPFWLFSTSKKQAGAKKYFPLKKRTYGTYGLPAGPKAGQFFFIVVPKSTPRKSDLKGARNVGAYDFHDIWAFGGPDLVKNGQNRPFDRKKNGHFF